MASNDDTTSVTDNNVNNGDGTIADGRDTTANNTQQTTMAGQQDVQQQQPPATVSQPATQQNPNYNHNNFGFNMGQMPQQWQAPQPPQQQQWQSFQPQPPHQWQMPQHQQWQPSRAQPLHYPHHSGYYPDPHHFQGNYYPAMPQFPHQQPQVPHNVPQQAPNNQHSAGTASQGVDTGMGNNGGAGDVADTDGNQSEVLTQNDESEEPQFFGAIEDRLKAWAAQRKQNPTEGPEVYEHLANYMMDHFSLGFVTQELDQSVKEFPVLKNVPLAITPELEKEIHESPKVSKDSSTKTTEQALKTIQKGIASSVNALGPLAEVIMRQSRDNEELNAVSPVLLDVIKLLAYAFNGISKKRRDLLRPHIDVKYQKLGKKDEGFDPKFLFGGNLSQRVNEVKASNSLMKEVMKPENKPQGQGQPRRFPSNNGGSGRKPGQSSGQRSSNRAAPYNRNNQGGQSSQNSQNKQDFRKAGPSGNSGGYKR